MGRIINYIKDTRAELKHVSWPTRKQAVAFTAAIIVLSLVVALFLALFDNIFTRILDKVIL
ncbi:MAG: preprotein translocase subunit SecE [Candidatus Paceibacterota bacterium]|jgi:preprotein translocase subunit SecE